MTMRMQLVEKPTDSIDENMDQFYKNIHSVVFEKILRKHLKIVEPWEEAEDTPKFTMEYNEVPEGMGISVLMEALPAEDATLSVWQLLNREEGTEVRPMHVSRDWESKTSVRGLTSGPGAGRTTGIYPPWAYGIEGRMFNLAVAEDSEAAINEEVYKWARLALTLEFS